ncbi:unnamed protein product, partial [Didymodactylos carnosus]
SDTDENQRLLSKRRHTTQNDSLPLNTATTATASRMSSTTSSHHYSQPNQSLSTTPLKIIPNSPMVKRSKFERDKCQKVAKEEKHKPTHWAYCLLNNVYSLWFMHLPTMINCHVSSREVLNYAYKILVQMNRQHLKNPDEICFRVIIQLCGLYDYPVLAVKTFSFMKRTGVEWNAITYGAYNKAVYEGTWPRHDRWATLRGVVRAVWAFKNAHRVMNNQKHQHQRIRNHPDTASLDTSSLEDSDGCSIDSMALANDNTNRLASNENLKDNRSDRGYYSNTNTIIAQDDTLTSVLSTSSHIISTLAGTIRDIAESPYFPKMSFKKRPSFDLYTSSSDAKVSNNNNNTNNNNNQNGARSIAVVLDMPSKLDFSTLHSIAHQTARSEAGILMTSSLIEIGDVGMLSYRLPAQYIQQSLNSQLAHPRRSISCLTSASQLKLKISDDSRLVSNGEEKTPTNAPIKWELASHQQVLTNDPLGLFNLSASQPQPPIRRIMSGIDQSSTSRTTLQPVRLFADETFQTAQNDV